MDPLFILERKKVGLAPITETIISDLVFPGHCQLCVHAGQTFNFGNYEVFSSASIGIIVSDQVTRDAEDFLGDADTAMYRAKESGKARCEVFDREMHAANMNLLQLETDLRRALSRNEFEVYYQPIVNMDTERCYEFEALIRWNHPVDGYIAPKEIISVAEDSGLIIPIGQWILHEACKQTQLWQRNLSSSEKLAVSVNLSAKQLMHPALVGQLKEILRTPGLSPRSLKLEVTESTVIERTETALAVLSEIKALGISLSMDDFGTGYSSLSYLHQFPFERLKDRPVVRRQDDPRPEKRSDSPDDSSTRQKSEHGGGSRGDRKPSPTGTAETSRMQFGSGLSFLSSIRFGPGGKLLIKLMNNEQTIFQGSFANTRNLLEVEKVQ